MRKINAAFFGFLGIGVALVSLPSQGFADQQASVAKVSVCAQVLESLKSEWNVVNYPTHSRVTTTQVEGRYGHQNTPAQIAAMENEMKKAEADCKAGNQQAAIQRVSSIEDTLNEHGNSQATANAAMIQK